MSFPIKSNIPYSTYCNLHLRQWIRCTGSVLCSYRYHPGPVSPNWYNLKRIWRRSTQTSRRLCRWGGTDASLVLGRGPCPVIVTFLPFNIVLNIYFNKKEYSNYRILLNNWKTSCMLNQFHIAQTRINIAPFVTVEKDTSSKGNKDNWKISCVHVFIEPRAAYVRTQTTALH